MDNEISILGLITNKSSRSFLYVRLDKLNNSSYHTVKEDHIKLKKRAGDPIGNGGSL